MTFCCTVKLYSQCLHITGCNCKRSGCLKNYCECYEVSTYSCSLLLLWVFVQAKIPCSGLCRCIGCRNLPDKPENKSLMHLADAAGLQFVSLAAFSKTVGLGRHQNTAAGCSLPSAGDTGVRSCLCRTSLPTWKEVYLLSCIVWATYLIPFPAQVTFLLHQQGGI